MNIATQTWWGRSLCALTTLGLAIAVSAIASPQGDPVGACCLGDGSCVEAVTQSICESKFNGIYQGDGTACNFGPVFCEPFGACCFPNLECAVVTFADCLAAGGDYQGDTVTCESVDCDPIGPCCLFDGTCVDDQLQSVCESSGGMFQAQGTFCQEGSVVCIPFGACCLPGGTCSFEFGGNCSEAGGYYFGDATDCAAVDCSTVGACCFGIECNFIPEDECSSGEGVFQGGGVACGPSGCVGACCLPDRMCIEDTAAGCVAAGGVPQGLFTTCQEVSCLFFETPMEAAADGAALGGSAGELNDPADADGGTTGGRDVAVVEPDMDEVQVFVNNGADADDNWLGFDPKPPISVGALPSDLVVARFDADSFADMAVANRGDDTISILINAGDLQATFMPGNDIVDPALNEPISLAAADLFNGDGIPDLVVANAGSNDIVFFENDGSASFSIGGAPLPVGTQPSALDPIDLDNDKDVDIVIAGGVTGGGPAQPGQVVILRRLPDGSYADSISRTVGIDPVSLAIGDFDSNGFDDIATANMGSATISLVFNNGPTPNPEDQFSQASNIDVGDSPSAVTAVDLDADGDVDLAVTVIDPVLGPAVQVLVNLGSAGDDGYLFSDPQGYRVGEPGSPAAPNYVAGFDLNNDGINDLTTGNTFGTGGAPGSVSGLISTALDPGDDCNDNGIPDACEIEVGAVDDCNGNGVPDECETEILGDPATSEASDVCADAQFACPGFDYLVDSTGSTPDSDPNCGIFWGVNDVWYRYRPAWSGRAFISIFGAPTNPLLSVYDGCPDDGGREIMCNDINQWGVDFRAVRGREYFFRLAGRGFTTGTYHMHMIGPDCFLSINDANGNGIPDDCECLADVDGNGVVDNLDFLLVMVSYGPCPPDPASCPADVDGSGFVNQIDLREVLLNLGPCPDPNPFAALEAVGPSACN